MRGEPAWSPRMAWGGHSLVGRKMAYLPGPAARLTASIARRHSAAVPGMAAEGPEAEGATVAALPAGGEEAERRAERGQTERRKDGRTTEGRKDGRTDSPPISTFRLSVFPSFRHLSSHPPVNPALLNP